MPVLDLDDLGLDRGGHLLLERALTALPVGTSLEVRGRDPHLQVHLAAWARARGHRAALGAITKGGAADARWVRAERAGQVSGPGAVVARPALSWGLAARGALVEAGGPPLAGVDLDDKAVVWSDLAAKLYAQAAAGQWDPATAVDWSAPLDLPPEVEAAVVQVMTYLIENEQAALLVPARFLGRIHPHFREVMQLLAVQVADEARHVEVFTRRAALSGRPLGTSGAGGRASLQTLLDEPDFSLAVVPAVGARRGDVPHPARLPGSARPRSRSPAHRPAGPAGRVPARGVRDRSPRSTGWRPNRGCGPAWPRSSSAATRR